MEIILMDPPRYLAGGEYNIILTIVVLPIFPILLLLLYPFKFFQTLSNKVPVRWHALHTFVDTFQGGYKNGASPFTRDFRQFSSFFLSICFMVFLIYILTFSSSFFSYATMIAVIITMLLIILEPFMSEHDNFINSGFLLLLSTWYVGTAGVNLTKSRDIQMAWFFYGLCGLVAILPVGFLSALLLNWLKKHKLFVLTFSKRCCSHRN